jgi:hypothetical protein
MKLGAENISKKLKEDNNQFKATEETKSSSANLTPNPSKDDASEVLTD